MSDFTATPTTAAGEDAEAQLRRLQGEVESLMRDKVTPAIVGAVESGRGCRGIRRRAHSDEFRHGGR